MTKKSRSVAVFLLFAIPVLAQDRYCPNEISTKQSIEKNPPDWTAKENTNPHTLAGLTFFDGPPEQEASLVYDESHKLSKEDRAVWRFDPSLHIWLSCIYSGTTITLFKQLPPKTTECRVTYSRQEHVDGYQEIKAVTCK
jgi:hypothetical protein